MLSTSRTTKVIGLEFEWRKIVKEIDIDNSMTVKQLIEHLQKFDPTLEVVVCRVGEYVEDIHTIREIRVDDEARDSCGESADGDLLLALHYH